MLPVAPVLVIPALEPIIGPAPEASVNVPPPVRVLVPMLSVAPLLTVKLMGPDTVPPDVKLCVPALLKTTVVFTPLPVAVSVPPAIEQSPLRLSVPVTLLASAIENVPPPRLKLPATF